MLSTGETVTDAARIKLNGRKWLQKYYNTPSGHFDSDSILPGYRYIGMLNEMLSYADSLGLDKNNYHLEYLLHCDSLLKAGAYNLNEPSVEDELIFNDAALGIFYDAAYGQTPVFAYNGLRTNIDSARVLGAFKYAMRTGNWRGALNGIEPAYDAYRKLKSYLWQYEGMARGDTISEAGDTVLMRLKAYDLLEDDSSRTSEIQAIKHFQALVDLDSTGVADRNTVRALLVPVKERVNELRKSLNYYRWMNRLTDACIVMVNIPGAYLKIFKKDSVYTGEMKVIAGKPSWRTPLFAAYIDGLTTYPYWVVPRDIAVKEMLPKIRVNLDYLDENELQVIDPNGQEVDPETMNWTKLNNDNFPYTIRQSTGCNNSLGVMKFDVNSPFSIYLHDTNAKALFNNRNRLLSHGCVRVENAMLLAEALTGNTLPEKVMQELQKCSENRPPSTIKLKTKCPLLIVYMLADVDGNGELRFYRDVYGLKERP